MFDEGANRCVSRLFVWHVVPGFQSRFHTAVECLGILQFPFDFYHALFDPMAYLRAGRLPAVRLFQDGSDILDRETQLSGVDDEFQAFVVREIVFSITVFGVFPRMQKTNPRVVADGIG